MLFVPTQVPHGLTGRDNQDGPGGFSKADHSRGVDAESSAGTVSPYCSVSNTWSQIRLRTILPRGLGL